MPRPAIFVAEPGRSVIDCPRAAASALAALERTLLGKFALPRLRSADLALADTTPSPVLAAEREPERNPATLK
jgi:hypothetical protein